MGDWKETTLGEVADWGSGATPKAAAPEYYEDGVVPWATIGDLDDRPFCETSTRLTEAGALVAGHPVPVGATLVSMYGTIGRTALTTVPMRTNQAIAWGFPKDDGCLPEFLFLAVQSLRKTLDGLGRGATQRNINRQILRDQRMLLPPITAQRRIVDVMAALDSQITALEAETMALAAMITRLRTELFGGYDVPTVRAGDKFDMLLGRQKSARQSVGDHVLPYLRAANITADGLSLGDVQTMNFEPNEQEKYGLRADDIVLVEGGTIGQAARWANQVSGVVGFDKHVIRLRARDGISTSEFALQWCHWCRETGAFAEQATGITIKALGFGRASNMPVPDLSIEDQLRLTDPLANAAATSASLRTELEALRALRGTLLTSLLSQAITIPETYDDLLEAVG